MAPTPEMVGIALAIRPQMVMLVPEGRMEVTTEGARRDRRAGQGDRGGGGAFLRRAAGEHLHRRRFRADPPPPTGASVCEVHTGPYAEAVHGLEARPDGEPAVRAQLASIATAGRLIRELGMQFNAGHAVNYENVRRLAALEGLQELHIGHSIVSRSIFSGMREAVHP